MVPKVFELTYMVFLSWLLASCQLADNRIKGNLGLPSSALLKVSEGTSFDFSTLGNIKENSLWAKTFTIENIGNLSTTNLQISGLATPFNFLGGTFPGIGGTCTSALAKNSSCTIVVAFSPTTSSTENLQIQIQDLNNFSMAFDLTGSATAWSNVSAPVYTYSGSSDWDSVGSAISSGDFNNDGVKDWLVAHGRTDSGSLGSGHVYVYDGTDGVTTLFNQSGYGAYNNFGVYATFLGDVNGDNYEDIAITEAGWDGPGVNRGRVLVYSGIDSSIIYTIDGTVDNEAVGSDLGRIKDINGDGADELIVGNFKFPAGAENGNIKVYSGADGDSIAALVDINGSEVGSRFGRHIDDAGDVDGDGKSDLLVSAYRYDGPGTDRGAVFIYSGATGGLIWQTEGLSDNQFLGVGLSGLGDVNGDGKAEFIIADSLLNAYVYDGATKSVLYNYSYSSGGLLPHSTGDIDGDGIPDFAIAEILNPAGGTNRGKVTFYSGATGLEFYSISGINDEDRIGVTLANIGDINIDGTIDFILGNGQSALGGTSWGQALVYYGP